MADQPEELLDQEIEGALAAAAATGAGGKGAAMALDTTPGEALQPSPGQPAEEVEPPGMTGRGHSARESVPDDPAAREEDPVPGASTLQPFRVAELQPDRQQRRPAQAIDLLRDVELDVKIELGRSRMLVEDVLRLGEDSVVELDKLAGDPVDVFVNGRLVARGEVLVLNDNFCVRISDIIGQVEEE